MYSAGVGVARRRAEDEVATPDADAPNRTTVLRDRTCPPARHRTKGFRQTVGLMTRAT
jgi:hypothetical protein